MNRESMTEYLVNGVGILVPDNEIGESYEDIDSPETGRDEGGYMHRFVARYKVGKWAFEYRVLSEHDYMAMEEIFGNVAEFEFTRPSRTNPSETVTTTCYRSKYSLSYHDTRRHVWKNYKFDIIEC